MSDAPDPKALAATMRERVAQLCDLYADENLRMAGDTILCCPVLSGRDRSEAGFAKADALSIEGAVHSAAYHAATHLAAMIRALPLVEDVAAN